MPKVCKFLAFMWLTLMTFGCASLWSSDANQSAKSSDAVTASKETPKASVELPLAPSGKEMSPGTQARQDTPLTDSQASQIVEQISLAQARTVERMAEIEAELRQQREKIKLLEQGLLTGIAPDDLKKSSEKKLDKSSHKASSAANEVDENIDVALGVVTSPPLEEPVLDADVLLRANHGGEKPDTKLTDAGQSESLFAKAKAKYQASDFSGALADFADLSRKNGENFQGGILRFWLGKCYAGLKEHSTARQEFEAYLARAPKSTQVAEARLELARVLVRLGLKERAQNELKRVISDFEGQEPAEVAAHELGTLQGAL